MGEKQKTVTRLEELERQALDDSNRWFGDVRAAQFLSHHVLALCGEVGELANLVKKIERGSLDGRTAQVQYDLAMETTDVFVYLLNIAGLLGIDLEKTNQIKRAQNEKRFMAQRAEREAARVNGQPQQ